MKFRLDWFLSSLGLLWRGMLGVFLVTAVIILVIVLLNRLTAAADKRGKSDPSDPPPKS